MANPSATWRTRGWTSRRFLKSAGPRDNGIIIITEKLDGTNAQVAIDQDGNLKVGSRKRWITPGKETDNFGFAAWCEEHREELLTLGPGRHFGEWWGQGIQRRYGLDEKRFSIFNTHRPVETLPPCVSQVPIIYQGENRADAVELAMHKLASEGSVAAPGFMQPEGVVVYFFLSKTRIKRTFEGDGHKWEKADGC